MTAVSLILGARLISAGLVDLLSDQVAVRVVGVWHGLVGLALIGIAVGWLPT